MPLSVLNEEYASLKDTSYALIGIGCGIIIFTVMVKLLMALYSLYKYREQNGELFDLAELTYVSMRETAFWVNAVCFMLAFTLLSWFLWNEQTNSSSDEDGTVNIIYIFIFISSTLY